MLYKSLKIIEHTNYQKVYIFTPFPVEDEELITSIFDSNELSFEIIPWSTKEILKSFFLVLFECSHSCQLLLELHMNHL
mgnify:CR=1 FL=1